MAKKISKKDIVTAMNLITIYKEDFERVGVLFSGVNPKTKLCELIELKNHPFFMASQFHPEFKSRPLKAHPLFIGFVGAVIDFEQ